jgi:hypothetical protein
MPKELRTKYKVIKDIIPKPFMFKPICKTGEVLYLNSINGLVNEDDIFICDLGSPIQIECTEEIIE